MAPNKQTLAKLENSNKTVWRGNQSTKLAEVSNLAHQQTRTKRRGNSTGKQEAVNDEKERITWEAWGTPAGYQVAGKWYEEHGKTL